MMNVFNSHYRERNVSKMTFGKNKALKAAALILLTSSVLFAASCSKETIDGNYILAEPDGKDYSYQYPVGWKELRADSMIAIESPDGLANISSSWYPVSLSDIDLFALYGESEDPEGAFLYDYITEGFGEDGIGYMEGLRENFGDDIVFDDEIYDIKVEGGERKAKKLVYHMKVGEEDYYHETVFVLLPDDSSQCFIYIIHYTAADETTKEQHRAAFDTVVNTFKFTTLFDTQDAQNAPDSENETVNEEAPDTVA